MNVTCNMEYFETGERCTISISGNKCLIDAIFDLLSDVGIVPIEEVV